MSCNSGYFKTHNQNCSRPRAVLGGQCDRDGPWGPCVDDHATCTRYTGVRDSNTYCLLPKEAECSSNAQCVSNDCGTLIGTNTCN